MILGSPGQQPAIAAAIGTCRRIIFRTYLPKLTSCSKRRADVIALLWWVKRSWMNAQVSVASQRCETNLPLIDLFGWFILICPGEGGTISRLIGWIFRCNRRLQI